MEYYSKLGQLQVRAALTKREIHLVRIADPPERATLTGRLSEGAQRIVPVRPSEAFQDGVVDADEFALVIEHGTAGTTRSCLGVVEYLARKHVAQMSLGDER